MTSIEEEKYHLRKKMEKQRDGLSEQERDEKSEQACQHVLAHPLFSLPKQSSFTVCTYMPFRSELDITPVMAWCWEQGFHVLVPRANRMRRTLHLHRIESYHDVETGAWGIREPKDTAEAWNGERPIDLIITPGLAFDTQGGRLGYGGGYYDRFMRSYQRAGLPQPVRMAIAYDMQVVDKVPMDTHDLSVDLLVTESGMLMNHMTSSSVHD